jgi:hypothetical protein
MEKALDDDLELIRAASEASGHSSGGLTFGTFCDHFRLVFCILGGRGSRYRQDRQGHGMAELGASRREHP